MQAFNNTCLLNTKNYHYKKVLDWNNFKHETQETYKKNMKVIGNNYFIYWNMCHVPLYTNVLMIYYFLMEKESYIHMHTSRRFETSSLQYLSTFLYFVGTICLLLKKMEILCMTGTTPKISKHIPMFRACCNNKGIVKNTHTIYYTLW